MAGNVDTVFLSTLTYSKLLLVQAAAVVVLPDSQFFTGAVRYVLQVWSWAALTAAQRQNGW